MILSLVQKGCIASNAQSDLSTAEKFARDADAKDCFDGLRRVLGRAVGASRSCLCLWGGGVNRARWMAAGSLLGWRSW